MTTLVGIVARKEKPGVVLASDLSRTYGKWTQSGDVAYRQQLRSEGQKIHVSDNRDFAVCMAGVFDQSYVNFLSNLLKGKINLKEALEKGCFEDFAQLNLQRWDGRTPDPEYANSLLIATRFDGKPGLYSCWPLGRVDKRAWTSIGSGSEFALNHISKQGKLIPGYIDMQEAVKLADAGLREASQDIYTGGIDLIAVLPDEIKEFGKKINSAIDSAKASALAGIVEELK